MFSADQPQAGFGRGIASSNLRGSIVTDSSGRKLSKDPRYNLLPESSIDRVAEQSTIPGEGALQNRKVRKMSAQEFFTQAVVNPEDLSRRINDNKAAVAESGIDGHRLLQFEQQTLTRAETETETHRENESEPASVSRGQGRTTALSVLTASTTNRNLATAPGDKGVDTGGAARGAAPLVGVLGLLGLASPGSFVSPVNALIAGGDPLALLELLGGGAAPTKDFCLLFTCAISFAVRALLCY